MIDEMIDLMRAGTFRVKPAAQTQTPGRTWKVSQDSQISMGGKSPGTKASSDPNNAGGIGDATGVIMLDRFLTKPVEFTGRSLERTVVNRHGVFDVREPLDGASFDEEGREDRAGH
jgi:hypothetical protein